MKYTATLQKGAHAVTKSLTLPADTSGGKNAIQSIGSTVSYARRYLTKMHFNLIEEGEDLDARTMGFIAETQADNIINMFTACQMNPEAEAKFLAFMGVKTVSEIPARDYAKAMTALMAKQRKVTGL